MSKYIYGVHKGIHIFDLAKTREHLAKMTDALKALQAEGKVILFVSTKQQAVPLMEKLARQLHQPMVTKRWIPGLVTNWPTLKRRIQYYLDLKKSFQTGEIEKYTKKEQTVLRKSLAKLEIGFSGVADLHGMPNAIFVIDAVRDHVAVLEAKKMSIPVFGICDSNANPDEFTEFVPANDDAVKSIQVILNTVGEAMLSVGSKQDAEDKE